MHGICNRRLVYRAEQTIRNLTCVDLETSIVVTRLEVTGSKKTGFVYLLDLFEGKILI